MDTYDKPSVDGQKAPGVPAMRLWLERYVQEHVRAIESVDLDQVAQAVEVLRAARDQGRTIFVCGNGGSAASASHLSVDLGKGASLGRAMRFRIVSLNENTAWLTALGNDVGYERVFVEQLANQAAPGDVLLTMSVSGNSPNVIKAVEYARQLGMTTIGLCSRRGGTLAQLANLALRIDSDHFGHCEDGHMFICHLLGYAFMENPK